MLSTATEKASLVLYVRQKVSLQVYKRQKHTTGGIPRWSPTLVLVARFSAYVWQSGRDAQFSLTYGRMYEACENQHYNLCYTSTYHTAVVLRTSGGASVCGTCLLLEFGTLHAVAPSCIHSLNKPPNSQYQLVFVPIMVVTEGNLAKDINFIKTPAAQPSPFEKVDCNVPTTNVRACMPMPLRIFFYISPY
jgi:hypothetical protein